MNRAMASCVATALGLFTLICGVAIGGEDASPTGATARAAEAEGANREWQSLGVPEAPPLLHEPKRHQPPAPLRAWVTSPRLSPERLTRSGYTSVQVNVDANGDNIVGDAANEPSIAIDPTDPNRIVIGWRQFDSIASDFRQAGWAYSHDGGQTWTFPGVLTPGFFRSDPVLGADPNGVFYYCSLDENLYCQMFRSFDGGVTWLPPVPMFGGDKPWFTIDATANASRGNIYAAWSGGPYGFMFTRSRDGGASFGGPYSMPTTVWGTLTVAPDGTVYVAGREGADMSIRPLGLTWSSNASDPNVAPTFGHRQLDLGGYPAFFGGPNPDGLLGQAWIASDHSGGPTHGNLYVLCSVSVPRPVYGVHVRFIRSSDGGNTWSAPVRVNDDPNRTYHWFGTLAVAPNGRIDAVWNDCRHDPNLADPTYSEVYYAYSTDAGQTWSRNIPITPRWNHFLGYPQQQKIGDNYHMISDNAATNLAYAATLNGEQDVYFVRIGDCNGNGVHDGIDIANGTSVDCNSNGIPDECELDCNNNGVADECDIANGTSPDCNSNGIPDECELANGTAHDCNSNGSLDVCDIAAGTSVDCNSNGVPDECDLDGCDGSAWCADCNSDGIIDVCDIGSGRSRDCNRNGVPDECDIASGFSTDLNSNGIPDECERPLYVDDDAPPGGDGRTWPTAYRSLADALAGAFLGQEIRVAQGTYKPAARTDPNDPRTATLTLRNGIAIYGGYAGLGAPDPDLRNPNVYVSILSGDLAGDDGPNFQNNGENAYHVVTVPAGTDATAVLDGVHITGGNANSTSPNHAGGGLYCLGGATLTHCTFVANSAKNGGGGMLNSSNPALRNCMFSGNLVTISAGQGGGMYNSSNPTLRNCGFFGNSVPTGSSKGGGLFNQAGNPTLTGCTFSGNKASSGGGVYRYAGSPTLRDCIVWGNTSSGLYGTGLVATYSDVQGGFAGTGNINVDPRFVDADGADNDPNTWADNDYHLSLASPCINAGDPAFVADPNETDLDGNPRVLLGRVDMGAYEVTEFEDCNSNGVEDARDILLGTSQDANSNGVPDECEGRCSGDMNCDRSVTFADIDLFVEALMGESAWTHGPCPWLNADCNGDQRVTFADIDPFVALIGTTCP